MAPQGVAGAIAAVILANVALLLAAIAKKRALNALQLQSRQVLTDAKPSAIKLA